MTAHAVSHVYFGLNLIWVSTCVLAITYATIMSEKVNRAIVALVGGPGDFRAQAFKAFENLKFALAAVGASFKDVVKINNYLVDMSHIAILREVRDEFVNTATPPASTTVAISQLARPGALFEIEAIAVLPAAANSKAKASKSKKKKR